MKKNNGYPRRHFYNFAFDSFSEIELNREEDVTDLFMDPSGNHVILVMRSHTNYYLHRLSKKPKQLSKFNVGFF